MATDAKPITPTQRFWRLLSPDKREIRNIYVYSIFNGLVNLSLPLGIQAIINLIQGGRINTSWIVLVFFVVLGVALTGVLQIYQLRITENLQQKIFARAAFEFAHRLPRIRMEALYRHYAPELMNRFFDTISVQKGLSKILIDFSAAGLQLFFGLVLLSFYHPFFIIFSVILVILVVVIFRLTANKGLQTSLMESKYKYRVAHWLEEVARTATTFKLAGATDLPLHNTDKEVSHYLQARENHFSVLVRQYSLLVVFKVLVATGLLAIGGILVMEQVMNIGQFIAAEIIILLVMASAEKLVLSLETIYDVLTALEKIGQVTDLELEPDQGIDLASNCGECGLEVVLQNAVFTYPKENRTALNGLSLHLQSNEKVVVSGPSGSGKSSLLHVLAGLYELQEGTLSYNGLPKGNLDLNSVRAVAGDSLSQEQLFEGTVMENITMGRPGIEFSEVREITDQLGLGDFLQKLPEGYETKLDPQGSKMPKSIVQKILLARSVASKPKMLLLENPVEVIEAPERPAIIDYLTRSDAPWTLIAVSTDPELLSRADRILHLREGQIVNEQSSTTNGSTS